MRDCRRHQEKKEKAMRENDGGRDDGIERGWVEREDRGGKGEWIGDDKDVGRLDLEEGV